MLRPLLFRSRGGLRCSSCRGMIFQPSRSSSSSGNGNANGKGSPASLEPKKVTVPHLLRVAREGQRKLSVVTAYDYPSAAHVCRAGVDVLLVGDSLGMVVLGYDTTQPVTVDEMLHHCRAVKRGAIRPLIIGDMPFGSYEASPERALETAYRFVKEGGVDAVKLEGGLTRVSHIKKIVDGGIAVLGHVGLTPQSVSILGGFHAQGRSAGKAMRLVEDALAVQEAGAFACVVECVPAVVGQAITEALEIPTIGIGAGPYTSGQVLVYHDMLAVMQHPHHALYVPRFCKTFANIGEEIHRGLESFRKEVESGEFPSLDEFSPYSMPPKEEMRFSALLREDATHRLELKQMRHKKILAAAEDDGHPTSPYGP